MQQNKNYQLMHVVLHCSLITENNRESFGITLVLGKDPLSKQCEPVHVAKSPKMRLKDPVI